MNGDENELYLIILPPPLNIEASNQLRQIFGIPLPAGAGGDGPAAIGEPKSASDIKRSEGE